jgi:hypothetical protein
MSDFAGDTSLNTVSEHDEIMLFDKVRSDTSN